MPPRPPQPNQQSPKQNPRGARIPGRVAVVVLWLTTAVLAGGLNLNNSIPGGPFFQLLIVALVMVLLGAAVVAAAKLAGMPAEHR